MIDVAIMPIHPGDVRMNRVIAENKRLISDGKPYKCKRRGDQGSWSIRMLNDTNYMSAFTESQHDGGRWKWNLSVYDPDTSMIESVAYWPKDKCGFVSRIHRTDVKLDPYTMTVDIKLTRDELTLISVGLRVANGTLGPLSDFATSVDLAYNWGRDGCYSWENVLRDYVASSVAALKAGKEPRFNEIEKLYIGWTLRRENLELDDITYTDYLDYRHRQVHGRDSDRPTELDDAGVRVPDLAPSGDVGDFEKWRDKEYKSQTMYYTDFDDFESYLQTHYEHFTKRPSRGHGGRLLFANTPETLFPFWQRQAEIAAERARARGPRVPLPRDAKKLRTKQQLVYV